jgi:tRNA 2-selenouridine synthase
MRQAPCIKLELALADRLTLLTEDYQHFVHDTQLLNEQLACLISIHGKDQIRKWSELSQQKKMPELIEELLLKHYDPAYHRAITRNFSQVESAEKFQLLNGSDDTYRELARCIQANKNYP